MNKGILLVASAYIFWGTHPLYWNQLSSLSALEIFGYRAIFSLVFITAILLYKKQFKSLLFKIKTTKNKFSLFAPSLLIGSNWLIYIWAVNNNYILETSLGYFFAPLLMVLLGVIFLKESLRKFQWLAVSIAAVGVILMTFLYGSFPLYGILMALTWSLYGFSRKNSPLNAQEGLFIDASVISIPAIFIAGFTIPEFYESAHFNLTTILLLAGTGVISGLPLIMFISGSKTVKYSLIGILQYIYPTLIFLVGTLVYNEEIDPAKSVGFLFIWIALAVYTIEGMFKFKKRFAL